VNAVRLGPVDTPIHRQAGDDDAPAARPDEIARWVGHLFDPAAEWVAGAVLKIHGGHMLRPPETV
jgi:NAD(P)-dependent dehydrogenase (short-subunit alcohol dehydrogenase family)